MIDTKVLIIGIISVVVVIIAVLLVIKLIKRKKSSRYIQNNTSRTVLPKKGSQRYNDILFAIDKALGSGAGLEVFYQPIYSAKDDKVVAAEALLRLFDDELGEISPEEFIPIAEDNGRIYELGQVTIQKVCELLGQERVQQYGIRYIEINLSIEECLREELVMKLKSTVEDYGVEYSHINFEIKESTLLVKHPQLAHNMDILNELGFSFSIDDYGTASSTVAHILSYPFQIVKVEKNILWKAMENNRDMMALCASINLVKDMNMKIVIEGVESKEMVDTLKRLGCDYLQGYYFSKAIPAEAFINLLYNLS